MSNKIYLIIGPSCSGKTQFVTNSFLSNRDDLLVYKDLIKITKSNTSILIGDYTSNNKVRGTDRVSRSQLKLIAPQIIKSFTTEQLNVVAEGINICWDFVLDELLLYKNDVILIYLDCSKDISLYRNHIINPNANDKWFKSVYTRSFNIFNKYKVKFNTYVVNTEYDIDFSNFSLDTADMKLIDSSVIKTLF